MYCWFFEDGGKIWILFDDEVLWILYKMLDGVNSLLLIVIYCIIIGNVLIVNKFFEVFYVNSV